jgi:hypothetical protein
MNGRSDANVRLTLSVSGGGYRATAFAAGAILGIFDSSLRNNLTSISSVSGGSIASAITVGGFAPGVTDAEDRMAKRMKYIGGLVTSSSVFTEHLLSWTSVLSASLLFLAMLVFLFPAITSFLLDNPVDLAFLLFFGIGIPLFIVLSAIPDSLYAVQHAVEAIATMFIPHLNVETGPTLADAGDADSVIRIYCATDLTVGTHVYIGSGETLHSHPAPEARSHPPCVLLSDVVAASAGFPGFRPLVFSHRELGLDVLPPETTAHPRRLLRRFLYGMMGSACLAGATVAAVARFTNYLSGWVGLVIAIIAIVVCVGLAARVAVWLDISRQVSLVDGGVCDNLGAAFSLLSRDERYPRLMSMHGLAEQTDLTHGPRDIILVVDSSKVFLGSKTGGRFASIIPMRLTAATRAGLQLLGNANGEARRQAIARMLDVDPQLRGAIVSITKPPDNVDKDLDWAEIVPVTMMTKTTLSALSQDVASLLMLQGHRAMQQELRNLGATTFPREVQQFEAFTSDQSRQLIAAAAQHAKGPYARLSARVRRLTLGLLYLLFLSLFAWGAIFQALRN